MELLPKILARTLPRLYDQEDSGEDAIVCIKFFDPCSNWTWYVLEYDGTDTFFGLVVGHVIELGYFSLMELKDYKGPLGLGIERDIHFNPTSLKKLRVRLEANIRA